MILFVLYILFVVIFLENIFFWVYLWQLKEYRFDRLFIHLRDTQQGRKTILSFQFILPLVGCAIFVIGSFIEFVGTYLYVGILALFVFLVIRLIRDYFNKKIKIPHFTLKALSITLLSTVVLVLLTVLPLTDILLWLPLLLFICPFIVFLIVFLFSFPTEVYTDIYVQKAKEKRKSLKNLQVIAVSGSYGKSSTKEIIASILSKKYSVVKTKLSNNTPLVIAKTILSQISDKTDFFVAELGAYKKGEIRQLAQMIGPTIAVTTAVSDQHLALYGGMHDVISSELELFKELPRNSVVLLNANSKGTEYIAPKVKYKNIFWYGTTKKNIKGKSQIVATNIVLTARGLSWMYQTAKEKILFNTHLLGVHTIENILPAVFLGRLFGLSSLQVQEAVKKLKPMPKTMQQISLLPGVTIIDDTFNASPESVFSSLDYLTSLKKRKLYVLSPLIELGNAAKLRHKEIGEKLATIDILFLTNKNFFNDIVDGIKNKNGKTRIITGSYAFIAQSIQKEIRKKDVVLFEGKEAGIVLKLLQ